MGAHWDAHEGVEQGQHSDEEVEVAVVAEANAVAHPGTKKTKK